MLPPKDRPREAAEPIHREFNIRADQALDAHVESKFVRVVF
jgi:hypothetical protein